MDNLVNEWLRLDPNPDTRQEIQRLWDARNEKELEARLGSRIEFGTAGLRGRMEAGFSRMNDLIIIQASQGLCAYILKQIPDARGRGVVVGHDHRHNSERWAQLTASAFIEQGVKVFLHNGLVHTPLVPFSIKRLNAAGGVMITASHNPKDDNGYKVYWENAVQIIGPHDEGISESIKRNLEPRPLSVSHVRESPLCLDRTLEMRTAYFAQLQQLSQNLAQNPQANLKFVSTAMHGVGHSFAVQAFETFRLPAFVSVKEQEVPDPEFPTVKFPNPEEKGALDLAMKAAESLGINYVLAQDPDADRFAAAERQPTGVWTVFSGDQLGVLFASWIIQSYKKAGKAVDKLAMVASTVSSKMVKAMAQIEGFKFHESLTGFKYIGNTALDIVKQGYEVPFGYEEAIGYMIGNEIRDKDGIAATVIFAELANHLHSEGISVSTYLNQLYERYGYFETRNSYFICRQSEKIDAIFRRLRNMGQQDPTVNNLHPSAMASYPQSIAGLQIRSVRDLTIGHGYDSTNEPSFEPALPLSTGQMITFEAQEMRQGGNSIVLTIRTSGTEPKIKYYFEASGNDRETIPKLLDAIVDDLKGSWMEAERNGLEIP